jgi:hypothetical protein
MHSCPIPDKIKYALHMHKHVDILAHEHAGGAGGSSISTGWRRRRECTSTSTTKKRFVAGCFVHACVFVCVYVCVHMVPKNAEAFFVSAAVFHPSIVTARRRCGRGVAHGLRIAFDTVYRPKNYREKHEARFCCCFHVWSVSVIQGMFLCTPGLQLDR